MNLKEKLKAVQDRLLEIKDAAEGREFTAAEMTEIDAKSNEATELKAKLERAEKGAALIAAIGGEVGVERFDGKSYGIGLTGLASRKSAMLITNEIRGQHGQKAFVTSGSLVTDAPLTSGVVANPEAPTSILEALLVTKHDSPHWRYLRQSAFTNNAAIVAPGNSKPVSTVSVEEVKSSLQVFAHLSEYVDKYLLADNDALTRFIQQQLLYGLGLALESEVLNGAGTTGHLTGLLTTPGIQTQAFLTDPLTTLRSSMTKLESIGNKADLIVVNISDWASIETTRTTSGTFDLGGPVDLAERKIWGAKVITSTTIAAGTALTLDSSAVGLDTDNAGVEVQWDASSGFAKNEVRARVEGRFGVSVFQPAGLVKSTLTGA